MCDRRADRLPAFVAATYSPLRKRTSAAEAALILRFYVTAEAVTYHSHLLELLGHG